MKIKALGRREPGTEHYYNLFRNISSQLPNNFECYYVWVWTDTIDKLLKINFEESNILIFCTDAWVYQEMADWKNDRSDFAVDLINLANINKDRTFYICSEIINAELEFAGVKNIKIMKDIVPPMMTHKKDIDNLKPILDKNFDSKKTSIALTRAVRRSRTNLLSYLFGRSLDNNTRITYNTSSLENCASWQEYCPWSLDQLSKTQRDALTGGWKLLKEYNKHDLLSISMVDKMYENMQNPNVDNFVLNLTPIYQNSFVELITETTFAERSICLGEKTSHAIFACNFPIVLSGKGAVQHLRDVSGFDMFDDVIDHSYDSIEDPMKRMTEAIDLNYDILSNRDLVKEKWLKCKDRFLNNVEVFRNHMTKKYEENLMQELAKIK